MKLLCPFYIYSTHDDWIRIKAQLPAIWGIVLNFCNGPGPTELDFNDVNLVNSLKDSNVKLFGYVSTREGERPISVCKTDIATWKKLWDVVDIFIDEVSCAPEMVGYYAELNCWIEGISVLNHGTMPDGHYIKAGNILCTAQYSDFDFYSTRPFTAWDVENRTKLLHIIPNCPLDKIGPTIERASRYAEYIYLTSKNVREAFAELPPEPYFERMISKLRTLPITRFISMWK